MATYTHPDCLSADLNETITTATRAVLIKSYSRTDSYATLETNILVDVAINSGNFTGPTASGDDMTASFDGVQGVATAAAATPDLHQAILDGTRILRVTDEVSNRDVFVDDVINLVAFNFKTKQPVQIAP